MRNGRNWPFFGPKNAPFCSENANLPNSLKRSAKRSEFAAFSRYKNRHFPVSRLKRSAKRPKLAIFWPKKRAVLQRKRQFATLYLFHAPTGEDSSHLLPSSDNSQAVPNISSGMQLAMILLSGATSDTRPQSCVTGSGRTMVIVLPLLLLAYTDS